MLKNITTARAATGCGTGVWTAKFHANTTFKGDPKKTACDTLITRTRPVFRTSLRRVTVTGSADRS
jgi:hypothetical protein